MHTPALAISNVEGIMLKAVWDTHKLMLLPVHL